MRRLALKVQAGLGDERRFEGTPGGVGAALPVATQQQ
jgi:hypothetical protein